mmetsp:Transcript_18718/g.38290  ORF Transcript_18718/g.38290 Transcript_18718/m.38290 type:complete len:3824 (+) Transcript_18718:165-11636(+)
MSGWSDASTDFGQKIDLTVRIREILRNYPEGLSILKELLQNADDAGARTVRFVVAESRGGGGGGGGDDALSAATRGPSLLAYNDAVFTETDFKSIQQIGNSLKKAGTGNKTGRFGVGVNSVYHLTEVPMFTSQGKVVLFDPQASFVPNINPANPGKMIDISSPSGSALIASLPSVFSPFKCFGCTLSSTFKGTMFRFALRTVEQAATSKLSRQSHTLEATRALMKDLEEEASTMLLFLKNVEAIETYDWPSSSSSPVLRHSTKISTSSALREKRRFVLTASLRRDPQPNDYAMEITSTGRDPETWVVCNQLGGGKATDMATDPELSHMKLVPWSGVAARLPSPGTATPSPPSGLAYCFLPLPVKTGLPVHVNGYFELSANRRDVWWGDDMAGDGRARAEWNGALVRDIAAPSYARLVGKCVKRLPVGYESLFPCDEKGGERSFSPLWEVLISAFYLRVRDDPVLFSAPSGAWLAPSRAVALSDPDDSELASILSKEGELPLVVFRSADLRSTLLKRGVVTHTTTPSFVRSYYASEPPHLPPSLSDPSDAFKSAKFLLLYCISDLSPSSGYRELHNLPFVTLADGRTLGRFSVLPAASPEHVIQLTSMGFTTLLSLHALRKFSGNLDSAIEWLFDHRYEASSSVVHGLDPYFVCGGAAAEILSTSPHMYVDEESLEDAPVLSKLYKSPSLQQVMNVTSLTPEMLGDVVNRAIPPDWRGEEEVEWDCNDAGASPSREWFSSLWSYICSNPASIPHVAEQYCLVPTNEGIVTNLSRGSSTISAALLSAPVIDAVTSLGVRTLLTGLFDKGGMKVPSEIFSYVFEPTPESVIFAIDAASRRGQQNWATVTPEKKEVLYDYLVTSAPKLPVAATRVLASFPIFQVYSSEGLCFSDLTGGGICTLSAPPTASDVEVFSAMASISKFCFVQYSNVVDLAVLKLLNVEVLHPREFYTRVLFPNIGRLDEEVVEGAVSQLLTSLPGLIHGFEDFKHVVSETECILTSNGRLERPCKLFDPENYQLTVLLDDSAFPSQFFRKPGLLLPLRSLGLLSSLTLDAVVEIAKRIEAEAFDASQMPAEADATAKRSEELLSFLDKNTPTFFPELFPSTKKTSMFSKLSNAIFEDGAKKKADAEARACHIETLKSTAWVPVHVASPSRFLPWSVDEGETKVASPTKSKTLDKMWLCSATYRLVKGEVHTPELKTVLGWNDELPMKDIALQLKRMAESFGGMRTATERADGSGDFNQLCQSISSEIPRIYHILNRTTTSYEVESVKSTLHSTPWLWMGDSFVQSDHAAFSSSINASPYLFTVPPDLACFSTLLKNFGVRDKFGTSDFCQVLRRVHLEQGGRGDGEALLPAHGVTELTVAICQFISDDVMKLTDMEIYAPDAAGRLHVTTSMVYDDAPWLSKNSQAQKDQVFVHPKISSDVGDKIGVKSLRQTLVTTNSESLDFGVGAEAEAFGQAESLTRRLRNIIEMYPEGPSILSELIQNADDSGATAVKVLISMKENGTSSLLGPKMSSWQGPAIYVYNNSTFSDRDFINLSRIGQASKLEKLITTGRFGLGFNAVFHWTDVPSFVSGDYLVMFDPHERYVPGATSTSRGIKIKFKGSDLLDQFPDQFEPYMKFGCDMKNRFKGTLFRFPLRTSVTAADSEISKTTFDEAAVRELVGTFEEKVSKMLLFLRNVREVQVYAEGGDGMKDAPPKMLYSAEVGERKAVGGGKENWSAVSDFITGGSALQPLSKEAFYSKLSATPADSLPSTCHLVPIVFKSGSATTEDVHLVLVSLGGGEAKRISCDEGNRHMKLLPWSGVSAHLSRNNNVAPPQRGTAFCFLPLPVETGLPVMVNGYFELSANRRDIWLGNDMTGEGRVRSDWNAALIRDAIAPLYLRLLEVARGIVEKDELAKLWPVKSKDESDVFSSAIWTMVTESVYSRCLASKVFWGVGGSDGKEGWVRLQEAVVVAKGAGGKGDVSGRLIEVLMRQRVKVVTLDERVVEMLELHKVVFDKASPRFLRNFYKSRGAEVGENLRRVDGLFMLEYICIDLTEDERAELVGVRLLPLLDGTFGFFGPADESFGAVVVDDVQKILLKSVPELVVDVWTENEQVNRILTSQGILRGTNVKKLELEAFRPLLGRVISANWQGLREVTWNGDDSVVTEEWVSLFWSYVCGSEAGDVVGRLGMFVEGLPLLPCLAGDGSRVLVSLSVDGSVIGGDVDERIGSILTKVGVKVLDVDVLGKRSGGAGVLARGLLSAGYAHSGNAVGVVRALRNLFPGSEGGDGDLMTRVKMRFKNVEPGERDELRRFLRSGLERDEDIESDEAALRTLKSLPLWETHERGGGKEAYLDLLVDQRWIAPRGANKSLLDNTFVHSRTQADTDFLGMLGVSVMSGKQFYLNYGLGRIQHGGGLDIGVRDEVSLKLLREVPILLSESGGDVSADDFVSSLKDAAWVKNRNGGLCSPSSLYDPDAVLLTQLLGDECFPAPEYCGSAEISTLRNLGLKRDLNCRGVVDSARGIAAGKAESDERRSRYLLRHLNDSIDSLLEQARNGDGENVEESEDAGESRVERFKDELRSVEWLLCKRNFVDDMLPLRREDRFLSALDMRPNVDAWLCSASKGLLDGVVSNEALRGVFGWEKEVDVVSLGVQLLAFGRGWEERGSFTPSFRQTLASIIPRIYGIIDTFLRLALEENEAGGESDKLTVMEEVKVMLRGKRWLFVGDGVVSSNRVAFKAPQNARPHLFQVPAEQEMFEPMFRYFDVRETFGVDDYIRVSADLYDKMEGQVLGAADLELSVGMAKLMAGLGKEEVAGRVVFLPTESGVLGKAEDMVFDDAPWLSQSLAGKLRLRFVHPTVGGDVALALGAKSLREVLLANQSGMQNIPCPSCDSLKQLLGQRLWSWGGKGQLKRERGTREDTRVLYDLFEVAEAAGVQKIKVLADYRTHGDESLLHPGLKALRSGVALMVCFEGVAIGVDELVRLSAPSGFYKSSTQRVGDLGSPRFGPGLASAFQMSDCLQVLSGNQLHLFDPTGQYLFQGNKRGKKSQPIARRYGLNKEDVFDNFQDQYAPFLQSPFGVKESFEGGGATFFKGTIFRICMRTKSSPLSKRRYEQEDVELILDRFSQNLGESFLFTRHLRAVDVDEWGDTDGYRPLKKTSLRTNSTVRNNFLDKMLENKEWKKSKLATLFKKWEPVKKTLTLEVRSIVYGPGSTGENDQEVCDTYMVASVLAPSALRDLATLDAFRKLKLLPLLRVSAHMHRSIGGENMDTLKLAPGRIFVSGFDTGIETGLGVNICAPLFLHELNRRIMLGPNDDRDVREIWPKIRIIESADGGRRSSTGSPGMLGGGSSRVVSLWTWNTEALGDAFLVLLPLVLGELRNPLEYLYARNAKLIYRYWPRVMRIKPRYRNFACADMYRALAGMELFLTKNKGFMKIKDGVFESDGTGSGMELSPAVAKFFRARFAIFNVPPVVGLDCRRFGINTGVLSPEMAKNLLRRSGEDLEAAVRANVNLAVDLFMFCLDKDPSAWKELIGLRILPLMTGKLGIVGKLDAIVATREQQLLLPNLRGQFLHPMFIKGCGLEILGSDGEGGLGSSFFETIRLKRLDLDTIAKGVSGLLPRSWNGKDSVKWSDDDWGGVGGVQIDNVRGPNALWLKLFWEQVKIFKFADVGKFSSWPLIPTSRGELASCRDVRSILCISRRYGSPRTRRILAMDLKALREKLEVEEAGGGDAYGGGDNDHDVKLKGSEGGGNDDEGWANFYGEDKEASYDSTAELSDDEDVEDEGEEDVDGEVGGMDRVDGGGIEVEVEDADDDDDDDDCCNTLLIIIWVHRTMHPHPASVV